MRTSQTNITHLPHRFVGRALQFATLFAVLAIIVMPQQAFAQRLENPVAVFAALDKVTAKIRRLEIPLNETVAFGALKVTPRVCYSRPATERPKTTSFVQINEIEIDGSEKKIFSGWMFAQSPGLNALEHPVFDIWLTGCQRPADAPKAAAVETGGESQPVAVEPAPVKRPPATPTRPPLIRRQFTREKAPRRREAQSRSKHLPPPRA